MKGIVLDFDGVLARSMELHAEAYRRTLEPLGVPVSDHDVFIREGARSETIIKELAEAHGVRLSSERVAALADAKQEVFAGLGPVELYGGAEDLVRGLLRPRVRLALVTGTRRENLDRLIPRLLPRFDAVLTQADYSRDKPDPEPYVKAAQALGLPAEACAALENAARGVQSAKAAGYGLVVGLTTTLQKQILATAGADVVVAQHDAAAQTLALWLEEAAPVTPPRGGIAGPGPPTRQGSPPPPRAP